MKKKILFVIPSLGVGGAEKSLVTLLSLFDYDKYDVSLLAFRHGGLLSTFLPKQVNIIGGTEDYEMFDGDAKSAVKYFLKNRKFSAAVDRIKYIINYRNKDHYIREKKQWGFLEKQLPKLEEKFDCAIGYLEGNSCYYVADDVNADKKIFFFHSDFNKLGIGTKISNEYFEKADKIVTVSEQCLQSIIDAFPDKSDKFCVIENITSREVINNQAQSKPVFNNVGDKTVLLSVGRIAPPKAIDLAVEACAELKKRKRNIVWYQIGAGPLEDEIRKLIDNSGVKDEFIMLGEKANPYPYINQCDIYVQTSRYEGKSIAIDEAKCLLKPIVVTNFPTVFDQISDGVDGLICEMNKNDIADKIDKLIFDIELRQKLSDNLKSENTGNEEEINKLYKLLED